MNKYEIILPLKISTNKIYAGVHWTKREQHKQVYRALFTGEILKAIKPPKTPCHIVFNFFWEKRPLDSTNCSYIAKIIEDCFVQSGILKDDSPKYVSGVTITSQKHTNSIFDGLDYLEFYFK